jgi:pimeloyl-ACP methyl ester carboxylesterase
MPQSLRGVGVAREVARIERIDPIERVERLTPAKIRGNTAMDGMDGPMLDVIDKGSVTDAHPVPLLFIHGAAHGAWCWDEHFLDFFAASGSRALAINLRGDDDSPMSRSVAPCSLADCVDRVASVADSLPARPVVIGHSGGGFVVQHYLEHYDAPAGVLMASTPPQGIIRPTLRRMTSHPWLTLKATVTGNQLVVVNTPERAREVFFSAGTPQPDVVRCIQRLRPESRKLLSDMMFRRPTPALISTPLLVLGAECDGSIKPYEVQATAAAYQTEAEFFPDMGHNMMLEPGWQAVAERIDGWLTVRGY